MRELRAVRGAGGRHPLMGRASPWATDRPSRRSSRSQVGVCEGRCAATSGLDRLLRGTGPGRTDAWKAPAPGGRLPEHARSVPRRDSVTRSAQPIGSQHPTRSPYDRGLIFFITVGGTAGRLAPPAVPPWDGGRLAPARELVVDGPARSFHDRVRAGLYHAVCGCCVTGDAPGVLGRGRWRVCLRGQCRGDC
jgi:hypothetical protein